MPEMPPIHVLFVAWRNNQQSSYHTVGRLIEVRDSPRRFEFAYVHGVQNAIKDGFRPLLAFPDLNQVYSSEELFPFFANRLIARGRPDYAEHVRRLGLDASTADEMTILARSGGVRATDSLELFPRPFQEPEAGCYQTYFLVHELPPSAHRRIEQLAKGERLAPLLDFQAGIALRTDDKVLVGYLPTYFLGEALKLNDSCSYIDVKVEQVSPPPAPIQQRLLCCLRSGWPSGFVPFSDRIFEPIRANPFSSATTTTTSTTAQPPRLEPAKDLFATIIGEHAGKSIRLAYQHGMWRGDGISVTGDRVLIDGVNYPILSRKPMYADLVHKGERIVITE